MNAVEIEQALSELAEQRFDAAEFPYAFLMAFGNNDTTIKRLCTGASNKSDFDGLWGGVLQASKALLRPAPRATSWQPSPPFVTAP